MLDRARRRLTAVRPTTTDQHHAGGAHDRDRRPSLRRLDDRDRRPGTQRPQLADRSAPTARSCCTTTTSSNQMAHFNRERVPERNVHAKGSGAFGDVRDHRGRVGSTPRPRCSSPASRPRCSPASRPSPASRARPDTWRDPRGFALKFYTTEGNYDLVGNNTPVFFIRDTMKFPHFIRSPEAPRRHRPARQRHAVGLLDASTPSRPTRSPTSWATAASRRRGAT